MKTQLIVIAFGIALMAGVAYALYEVFQPIVAALSKPLGGGL